LSQSPSSSESFSPSASPSQGYEEYTRGNYAVLPSDDSDLEVAYSEQDYIDVDSKNNVRVIQAATGQFTIHQFKDYVGSSDSISLEWEGQTNLDPTMSTVYLQIYNRNTTTWETVDSDNTSGVDTDFILTANISNISDYKDSNTVIASRVYQEGL
jgi:hypothetical protein